MHDNGFIHFFFLLVNITHTRPALDHLGPKAKTLNIVFFFVTKKKTESFFTIDFLQ